MHIVVQRISRLLLGDRDRVLGVLDQGIVSGTRFLTTVLIGRACAPEELGLYSLGFSIVLIALAILESLVSRPYTVFHGRLSESERLEYAGSALVHFAALALLTCSAFVVASAAMSFGLGSELLSPVMLILAISVPFVLLWEFGRRMAFAHLRVRTALFLDLGLCIVQLSGLAIIAQGGWLSAASAHGTVGVACGAVALSWLMLARSNFRISFAQIIPEWKRSWFFGRWIVCQQVVEASQTAVTYWLVALVLDSNAAGLFAAAFAIIAVSNPFIFGMANILTPKIANAYASGGISAVRRSVLTSTLQLQFPIVSFCTLMALFGDRVLALLFGAEFADAGAILPVLALSFVVWALCIPASIGLVTLERTEVSFQSALANLAVTAVCAPPAMAAWGLIGAAWAWLAGIATAALIIWIVTLRIWSRPTDLVTDFPDRVPTT